MPLYEYTCRSCGTQFEYLVLGADDVPHCPSCQSEKLQQDFSLVHSGSGGGKKSEASASQAPTKAEERGHVCGPGCGHRSRADALIKKKFGA